MTMDLRDLGKMLLEQGITGAPVVDGEGRLAGVISQTDLIYYNLTRGDELVLDSNFYHNARVEGRHVPSGFQFEDFNTGCVADVMTPVVHAVHENATVESVARMMTRKHIHRVIVQRGRRVAGVISALDVLRVHGELAKAPAKKKSAKKKPSKKKPAKKKPAKKKPIKKKPAKKKPVRSSRR
jgi:CBS domain-containing protein